MKQSEINQHPNVRPYFEKWQRLAQASDRVSFDGRSTMKTRKAASDACEAAYAEYKNAKVQLQGGVAS